MFGSTFYHQSIRKAVSVFGSIFDDINIIRRDSAGNALNMIKVPLAYGPKQKFLARIDQQESLNDPKIAIKLPRLSFEITAMTYDTNTKLQKGQRSTYDDLSSTYKSVIGPVGYRMGMQLNIIAKNQDDALQILEQILPYFQPQYTVTVKDVDSQYKSDMPITLQSVTLSDDYEGDYLSRRALVYTLEFETRIRFYGPIEEDSVIKQTITTFINDQDASAEEFLTRQDVIVNPRVANESDVHQKIVKYVGNVPENIILQLDDTTGFLYSQQIVGGTTGSSGFISDVNGQNITIIFADGLFEVGETVSVVGEAISGVVQIQTEQWN